MAGHTMIAANNSIERQNQTSISMYELQDSNLYAQKINAQTIGIIIMSPSNH
jgi:hypothetical protein